MMADEAGFESFEADGDAFGLGVVAENDGGARVFAVRWHPCPRMAR
jgi:hypothetical protein